MLQLIGASCIPMSVMSPRAIVALLYFLCIVAIAVSATRAYRVARSLGVPGMLAACIVAGALIYMSMLIPGVLGVLQGLAVFVTLMALSIILNAVFLRRADQTPTPAGASLLARLHLEMLDGIRLAALVLGLLASAPLIYFAAAVPFVVLSRGWPLGWDAVSYHVPGFVGFLQACSLWRLDAVLQSYSYGFELIGGFPATFFPSHWGFVVAHCYSVFYFTVAILLLVDRLARTGPGATDFTVALSSLFTLALWSATFREQLWNIGKNDIFMGASVVAMFALLLTTAETTNAERRRPLVLFLASGAMALAVATKPSAFAYLPVYGVLLWRQLTSVFPVSRLAATLRCLLLIGAVCIAGSFFYVRNILAFGTITHPELSSHVVKTSILGNVLNPRLYELNEGSAAFMIAIGGFAMLSILRRQMITAFPYRSVMALNLVGLGAFLVTPWAMQTPGIWYLRQGMAFFAATSAVYAIAVTWLVERSPQLPIRAVPSIAIVLGLSFLPWWWSDQRPRGLPGFEHHRRSPGTEIYRWIQTLPAPHRIYAAGLRPYGLYGPRWENRVVYELATHDLEAVPENGVRRIMSVMETFNPDLIIVALDPFRANGADKPLISWLRTQDFLLEVYCDPTASAFAVVHGDASRQEWNPRRCAS